MYLFQWMASAAILWLKACPSPVIEPSSICTLCDPDYVPVCDRLNEAGLPGGEQPTAAPRSLPEGKTRQEEHGTMRCFAQP